MAVLDSRFYRILFKAVDKFKPDPLLSSTKVSDSGRTYFVFKKPALKLFRLLTPWYEGSEIQDDSQLIDKLFTDSKTNQALINLTKPTFPPHPDQQVLNEWDKLISLPDGIKPAGPLLDLASKVKQFIIRHPIVPVSSFSGLVGSVVAIGIAGPAAALPGFVSGAALPSLVKIGLLNKLPVFKGRNALPISQLSKLFSTTGASNIYLWVIVLGIIILLPLLFMLPQESETGSNLAVGTPPTSDISSCEFLNHGRYYRISSSKLRNLISEAAEKTAIPSSVLTAIAIQESANFAVQATDDHLAFSQVDYSSNGCDPYFKTSPTGALGLMQVQPPPHISTYGTNYSPISSDIEGIKIGLRFLSRDYNSLTKNDFCDIKTNLYLGAGVIINKNGGKPPTTADEIERMACKYHGSCKLGSFNYAGEVRQGYDECKSIPSTIIASATDCPILNGRVLCGSQFTPINGCGHCGLNYSPIQYCSFPGTKYGLDIAGKPLQQVILPKINDDLIQWDYIGQEAGSTQAIIKYAGTNSKTNKKYFLQIHHSEIGSNNPGSHMSGELAALICSKGCDHTHIQISDGSNTPANINWLDAAQMFCRKI